jgi:CheY-like chemotaxis protein
VAPVHTERLVEQVSDFERAQVKRDGLAQVNDQLCGLLMEIKPLRVLDFGREMVSQHAWAGSDVITVLFAEDDPAVAQMYKLSLEHAGYRVYVASDGLMALEMARRLLPDIMFLDIRMPKMDGLTVLETLRSDPLTRPIPAVILSNWNEKELVERTTKLGGLDHLTKSQTTPAHLIRQMRDWLKP